jgi:serine/threonine-protein kinase
VKPGNLLLSDQDVVKLADFGIARAADQSSITQVGSVLGTAAYLSPEQARGDEAGPRADLYSLGVVTYQLITGRLPYEASSLSELALKQQRESPLPLNELVPAAPRALAEAVQGALAIDQRDRPEEAMEFAAELRDGAKGIGSPGGVQPAATSLTRVSRPPTSATRVARSESPRTADHGRELAGRVQPPRQVPAGRSPRQSPQARRVEQTTADRRSHSGLRRLMVALVLIAIIAVLVVVAFVIGSSKSNDGLHLRSIAGNDAQHVISEMRSLVHDNTR